MTQLTLFADHEAEPRQIPGAADLYGRTDTTPTLAHPEPAAGVEFVDSWCPRCGAALLIEFRGRDQRQILTAATGELHPCELAVRG